MGVGEGMEAIKGAYIFYTFNTLEVFHIEMAIQSIAAQEFEPIFDFILYNNSSYFDSKSILDQAQYVLGNKFNSYVEFPFAYPVTTSTMEDVQMQLFSIDSYDLYLLHKSDFSISNKSIQNVIDFNRTHGDIDKPYFLNFCKYDLRENVSLETTKELLNKSFDEILADEKACDLTEVMPEDWGVKYEYIGYRGLDGVMHAYNEKARTMLHFDSFINYWTVDRHVQAGFNWIYGDKNFLALHIFHALPGGRNSEKDIPGYRF